MNTPLLNDPLLQSLEARLASVVPQVSQTEQQQILYECAFAAGRKAGVRSTRCWQAATAVLGCLVVGFGISHVDPHMTMAPQDSGAMHGPWESQLPQEPKLSMASNPNASVLQLDAWQIQPGSVTPENPAVQSFAKKDPHLQSLTMGELTLRFLE